MDATAAWIVDKQGAVTQEVIWNPYTHRLFGLPVH